MDICGLGDPVRAVSSACSGAITAVTEVARAVWEAVKGFFQGIVEWLQQAFACLIGEDAPAVVVERIPDWQDEAAEVAEGDVAAPAAAAGRDPAIFSDEPPEAMLRGVQVNRANLARAPQRVNLAEIIAAANLVRPPIQNQELANYFNELVRGKRGSEVFCMDGRPVSIDQARDLLNRHYVLCNTYNAYDAGDVDQARYLRDVKNNIEALMKAVILELRRPGIPEEKKQRLFEGLVQACGHCPPRRLEQALRAFKEISGQMKTVEEFTLEMLQDLKEEMLRESYPLSREPVQTLNHIRFTVGAEFGLDCSPINTADMYRVLHDASFPVRGPYGVRPVRHTTAEEFRERCLELFTPINLLRGMQGYLNRRIAEDPDFARELSQYISNETPDNERDPEPYIIDSFVSDDPENPHPTQNEVDHYAGQVRMEGVLWLLEHFGILNRV